MKATSDCVYNKGRNMKPIFEKLTLNHIAVIVSSEDGVTFYKELGFEEISRVERPESHDELIYLTNGDIVLELYKDPTHPDRVTAPEAYGLRHLCFEVDHIDGECLSDENGRFTFLYDPDGQPIEIRER